VTVATGNVEVEVAGKLFERRGTQGPGTVGGDKGYDQRKFIESARAAGLTPHVAQKIPTHAAIDERTTRRADAQAPDAARSRIRTRL
jgi:hypothetical protein